MNEPIVKYLKYAFIGLAVAELCTEVIDLGGFRHLVKPLLMPVLLVYLRKGTTGPLTLSLLFAAGALICSFVGDSLLMYAEKDQLYFLGGLGAFAIAQLLYIISFTKAVDNESTPVSTPLKMLYAVPFMAIGLGLLWMIWPGLNGLEIPVIIYGALIVSMALSAVYRSERTSVESANQVILGACFFILSDALLAIDRFHTPMENGGLFIMITYLLAQWNIINGLQRHYNR